MRLIMLSGEHTVYGKPVRAGEEFEVPDNEGVTWIKLGRAKKAERPARRYSRADMRAQDE